MADTPRDEALGLNTSTSAGYFLSSTSLDNDKSPDRITRSNNSNTLHEPPQQQLPLNSPERTVSNQLQHPPPQFPMSSQLDDVYGRQHLHPPYHSRSSATEKEGEGFGMLALSRHSSLSTMTAQPDDSFTSAGMTTAFGNNSNSNSNKNGNGNSHGHGKTDEEGDEDEAVATVTEEATNLETIQL